MKHLLLALALMISLIGGTAQAQTLSRNVATRVYQAYELQSNDHNDKAIKILQNISTSRVYDTSVVQRMLGILYWQQKQTHLSEKALSKAVEANGLPVEQHLETLRMLADIQLSNGHTRSAIKTYHEIIAQNNTHKIIAINAIQQVWLRIAQGNYQLQQWQPVIDATNKYVALGGAPQVSVLNLRLGAELSLQKWHSALKTTLALRGYEPDITRWWLQTINLYLQLQDYPQALAALKQYQRAGFTLTETQRRMMAQLYSKQNVPFKAAEVFHALNKADNTQAKDLAIEAQYWQQAREWDKSLKAWARATEKESKYRWSYIQLLMQNKQYKTALTQLKKQKTSSRTELTSVEAYYRLGDIPNALRHAQKANQINSTPSTINWVKYLTQLSGVRS
ncbi:hypothetical protein VHA01S_012_00650 [Vibrio halioticoli NBRC 102217]|uniref:Uncharacterized protein n=1 Tax=Vibrio halioticoli NBRC 102217 TaxID=1219072 RepID=V5F1G3_9VIBR|nr:tetratricopeptide repeat protein [Vibrio halioticoli]GAD88949.1 hypothetical protein VHA01S_012_00650 [Vibrio halioticoli NBRC 102217]